MYLDTCSSAKAILFDFVISFSEKNVHQQLQGKRRQNIVENENDGSEGEHLEREDERVGQNVTRVERGRVGRMSQRGVRGLGKMSGREQDGLRRRLGVIGGQGEEVVEGVMEGAGVRGGLDGAEGGNARGQGGGRREGAGDGGARVGNGNGVARADLMEHFQRELRKKEVYREQKLKLMRERLEFERESWEEQKKIKSDELALWKRELDLKERELKIKEREAGINNQGEKT